MSEVAEALEWLDDIISVWEESPASHIVINDKVVLKRGEWWPPKMVVYAKVIQQLLVDMHEAHERTELLKDFWETSHDMGLWFGDID